MVSAWWSVREEGRENGRLCLYLLAWPSGAGAFPISERGFCQGLKAGYCIF